MQLERMGKPGGSGLKIDGDLARLIVAVGGKVRLAELLGVSKKTIYLWWREGRKPLRAHSTKVNRLCRKHGIPEIFPSA